MWARNDTEIHPTGVYQVITDPRGSWVLDTASTPQQNAEQPQQTEPEVVLSRDEFDKLILQ